METTLQPRAQAKAQARPVAAVSSGTRALVIGANVIVSTGLAATGLTGMLTANRGLGVEHPWSALIWVLGIVSFFLIPLEICVLNHRQVREK